MTEQIETPVVPEPDSTPAPVKPKRKTPLIVILIVLAVFILAAGAGYAWYSTSGPCGTKLVASAVQDLSGLHDDFNDYVEIASSTSRIALTGPVTEMQNIKKEAQSLIVPTCLDHARSLLVDSMSANVSGFLLFMAQEKDSLILEKMQAASDLRMEFYKEIARIDECKPFCK